MIEPKYNIGDQLRLLDEQGWWTIVNIYINTDIHKKGKTTIISYGVEQGDAYLEIVDEDVEEYRAGKYGFIYDGDEKLTVPQQIDRLLYKLTEFKQLGDEFKEEYDNCIAQLKELTEAGE